MKVHALKLFCFIVLSLLEASRCFCSQKYIMYQKLLPRKDLAATSIYLLGCALGNTEL